MKYEDYVREGRKLLSAVNCYQCMIGYYATMVCDLSHGGRKIRGQYTVKKYAQDIGMHPKTLSEWIGTYRNVIEKLSIEPTDVTQADWTLAQRVHALLKNEKRHTQELLELQGKKNKGWRKLMPVDRVRELWAQNRDGRCTQLAIDGYTDAVIGIKNKLRTLPLDNCSEVSIMALKKNLDDASGIITNYMMDHKNISMTKLQELSICL